MKARGRSTAVLVCVFLGACGADPATSAVGAAGRNGGDAGDAAPGAAGTSGPTSNAGSGGASAHPEDAGEPSVVPDAATQSDGAVLGPRLNELQVAGTHNSYHIAPAFAFHPSHAYTHLPLPEQLDGGVRVFELDLHARPDGQLDVYHIAGIDPLSTCALFSECLQAIADWSSAHPDHVPIFVWIEIKDDTGGQPITSLSPVESVISAVFDHSRLITPMWLKSTHESLRARLTVDGWPRLEEVRGKVMFILLNRGERAREYTHDFTHLDDRLMFANATAEQLDMPWVVLAKLEGDLAQGAIAEALARDLLLATNVCTIDKSDEECATRNAQALQSGFHMLKDDLPFSIAGRAYALTLPQGSPGCNQVTATDRCAVPLE